LVDFELPRTTFLFTLLNCFTAEFEIKEFLHFDKPKSGFSPEKNQSMLVFRADWYSTPA
jgi:hypothetical protein